MIEKLLTAAQVAEILQVKTDHVYQLKAEHKIPFIKVGGALRFSEEQIKNWLEQNSQR